MTQETEDRFGQPPSPSHHQLPPSPSPNGDISLEASLSNVSLGSSSSDAGPSRSPRLSNGRRTPPAPLELSREVDIDLEVEGDIGVSLTSPTRTSSPSNDYFSVSPSARRSSSRLDHVLSRSPSPSPSSTRARQRSLTPNGHLEVSPTKISLPSPTSLSPPLSAPPSRRSFSLRSISSRSPSPPPQPFALKPPLPNVTSVILSSEEQGAGEVDDSAPFESIPLSSTPPLTPTVPPPISPSYVSPERKGRQSWGGFGMTKEGQRYAIGETPDHIRSQTEQIRRASATSSIHSTHTHTPSINGHGNGSEATSPPQNAESSAPTPRLHAPPAHPFPFPIPSEPYSEDQRRISTSQPHQQTHNSVHPVQGGSSVETHEHGIGVKETISTFEKVRSHTRPAYLPPKDKHEDEVHLHQWEEIMMQSREHEKQVRKLKEQRKLEREKKLTIVIPKWEALLHDKEFNVQRVQNDPGLRNMWFEGVPTHLRGLAWSKAIGNPLAVSKDAYRTYVTRSEKAQKSGRFPQDVLDQMEKDMDNTLPTLRLYHRGSPLRDDLKEIMCAWVVYRSDDGLGYAPYISHLSAMFLLVSPPAEAFISLINLLSRPCLRSFYSQTEDEIDAYYRVLENLQADAYPKIYANLKNLGLRVPEGWFRGMLVEQVDFECACRLWDQIMLDGDGYIFRTALAIFGFLEPRLYYPDHDEILSVLEGHNPATLAIQARERERAKLRGETFDELIDGKLSVFGLNEHTLFEWLGNDGWKEKAFERLVLREMPD
ncbi:hypothetical protein I204_01890 [Kwoniella mangroviensis CBS 8886]|uniref:uncharacterized protein n=1 Tax=Kwoniella mangroviensis CBS 8507 TaxID=1296122 RepID=UPI00080D364E|nr:uncharacterized protein I203_03803 [Kwoniella mangroviensis CBS 8507]OCF67118.1 hypothetical protein I203_03803 [Kwoniella mangroviensis CBS 8507]OCF77887.1 hypothetical protein I204_01890 [Kwoniella mangroviensis CBS 8886]